MAQGLPAAALPLHEQGSVVIDGHGPGGVGLRRRAHRDPVAGHKAPGLVFLQTVKGRAESQQLPGDGPGQSRPADRGGPARKKAACHTGQLLRPVGGGAGQVQADAHHQPFQLAALHAGARLGQDAADLFALIVEVVDPFDAQLQPAQGLYGPGHGYGGADGHGQRLAGGDAHPQHQREVDPLARRALEDPALPAPARRLMACQHQRAVGSARQRQLLGGLVGAFQRVVQMDGCGVGPHRLGAEGVAPGQPIAPAGHGFQRVALGGEGGGGLVDGRPAHPQPPGQRLA